MATLAPETHSYDPTNKERRVARGTGGLARFGDTVLKASVAAEKSTDVPTDLDLRDFGDINHNAIQALQKQLSEAGFPIEGDRLDASQYDAAIEGSPNPGDVLSISIKTLNAIQSRMQRISEENPDNKRYVLPLKVSNICLRGSIAERTTQYMRSHKLELIEQLGKKEYWRSRRAAETVMISANHALRDGADKLGWTSTKLRAVMALTYLGGDKENLDAFEAGISAEIATKRYLEARAAELTAADGKQRTVRYGSVKEDKEGGDIVYEIASGSNTVRVALDVKASFRGELQPGEEKQAGYYESTLRAVDDFNQKVVVYPKARSSIRPNFSIDTDQDPHYEAVLDRLLTQADQL